LNTIQSDILTVLEAFASNPFPMNPLPVEPLVSIEGKVFDVRSSIRKLRDVWEVHIYISVIGFFRSDPKDPK
jgi:hypothetical protein